MFLNIRFWLATIQSVYKVSGLQKLFPTTPLGKQKEKFIKLTGLTAYISEPFEMNVQGSTMLYVRTFYH